MVGYINGEFAMGKERWRRLNYQIPILVFGSITMAIHAIAGWDGFVRIMSAACNAHSC